MHWPELRCCDRDACGKPPRNSNRRLTLIRRKRWAYGGAAELDYYEGRVTESRRKSIYAHQLDPDEPDYLITYARASSRSEDFKEAADAYELFLQVAPASDGERRDRIAD